MGPAKGGQAKGVSRRHFCACFSREGAAASIARKTHYRLRVLLALLPGLALAVAPEGGSRCKRSPWEGRIERERESGGDRGVRVRVGEGGRERHRESERECVCV